MCHNNRCSSLCNFLTIIVFITVVRLDNVISGSHSSSIGELHASESIRSATAQQSTFKCAQKFGHFRHSTDCGKYYICSFGIAFPKNCTDGLHFSLTLQICDWPINALCDSDNNNNDAFDSMYNYRIDEQLSKNPKRYEKIGANDRNSESNNFKLEIQLPKPTPKSDSIDLKPWQGLSGLINSGSNIKSTLVKPNGYYVVKSINAPSNEKQQSSTLLSSPKSKLISRVAKVDTNDYFRSQTLANTPILRSTAKPLTQLVSSINTEEPNVVSTTVEPIRYYYKSETSVKPTADTPKSKLISSFTRSSVTNVYNTDSERKFADSESNDKNKEKVISNQNQRLPINGSDNIFVFVKPLNDGLKLVKKLVKIKKKSSSTTRLPEFQYIRQNYAYREPKYVDQNDSSVIDNTGSGRVLANESNEKNQTIDSALLSDHLTYQRQRLRQQKYFRKIGRTPRVKSWSQYSRVKNVNNNNNGDIRKYDSGYNNRESLNTGNNRQSYRHKTESLDDNNLRTVPEIVINDNTDRQLKLVLTSTELRPNPQQQRTQSELSRNQKYETVNYIPVEQPVVVNNSSTNGYHNEDYFKYDSGFITGTDISKQQGLKSNENLSVQRYQPESKITEPMSVKIKETSNSASNLKNEMSWRVQPNDRLNFTNDEVVVLDSNAIRNRQNSYMDFLGFANSPKLKLNNPVKIIELQMRTTQTKPTQPKTYAVNYGTNIYNSDSGNITNVYQPQTQSTQTTPYEDIVNTKILHKPSFIESTAKLTPSTTTTTTLAPTELTISPPRRLNNSQEIKLFKPRKTTQSDAYYTRHRRIYEPINSIQRLNDSSVGKTIDSDNNFRFNSSRNKSKNLTTNLRNIYNPKTKPKLNPYSVDLLMEKNFAKELFNQRNIVSFGKTTPKPQSSVNYMKPTKKRFKYKPKLPSTTTTTTTTTTESPMYEYYYDDDDDEKNAIRTSTKVTPKSFSITTSTTTPTPPTTTKTTTTSSTTEKPYYEYDYDYKTAVNDSSDEYKISKKLPTSTSTTTTTQKPSTIPSIYSRKARPTNKRLVVKDVSREPPKPASRPKPVHPTPQPLIAASKCDSNRCKLPDCRCGGSDIPENINTKSIPQIVMITFDDAVNDLNWEIYEELFGDRFNPNGCPIRGTFYVSHEWTDYGKVQTLYSRGHEIASHGITHSFGEKFSKREWIEEINGQREILHLYGGVKFEDIRGMRAPFLQTGGNNMFEMLYDTNFTYDSSLPVSENNPPFFPYTLDYALNHHCMIPPCPTKSFPGIWEVGMTMWQDLRGGRCSMGDACTNPRDEAGVYDMLLKNFNRHYKSNRAPFGLYYHSAWFNTQHHRKGFIKFLDEMLEKNDVYFLTNWQMLQWMRSPAPLNDILEFNAWKCEFTKTNSKSVACNHPNICNVNSKNGARQLRTCQPCPSTYPWLASTGFEHIKFA